MKRLLIVVDYQNDFVDGSLGFPGAELLEEPIAAKIEEYRSAADVIAFTFDTHRCDYLETQEGRNLPVEHCIEGAPGHALYGRIAELIRPTDEVFEKPSFGSADLFEWLRAAQPPFKSIELVGLVSNICVISNACWRKRPAPRCPSSWTPPAPLRSTTPSNEKAPRRAGGPAGPSDQPGFGGLAAC